MLIVIPTTSAVERSHWGRKGTHSALRNGMSQDIVIKLVVAEEHLWAPHNLHQTRTRTTFAFLTDPGTHFMESLRADVLQAEAAMATTTISSSTTATTNARGAPHDDDSESGSDGDVAIQDANIEDVAVEQQRARCKHDGRVAYDRK